MCDAFPQLYGEREILGHFRGPPFKCFGKRNFVEGTVQLHCVEEGTVKRKPASCLEFQRIVFFGARDYHIACAYSYNAFCVCHCLEKKMACTDAGLSTNIGALWLDRRLTLNIGCVLTCIWNGFLLRDLFYATLFSSTWFFSAGELVYVLVIMAVFIFSNAE